MDRGGCDRTFSRRSPIARKHPGAAGDRHAGRRHDPPRAVHAGAAPYPGRHEAQGLVHADSRFPVSITFMVSLGLLLGFAAIANMVFKVAVFG